MTSKPDIIGIVTELQKYHGMAERGDHKMLFAAKAFAEFPRIAEALLIAVEALEQESAWNKGCGFELDRSGIALSRIKSL